MEKITNPVKAIRAKCLDCNGGSSNEVKLCPAEKCPLHPFRFGKNPYRTRKEFTPEELAVMRERMRRVHAQNSRSASATSREETHEAPPEGKHTTPDQNPTETLSEPYRGHEKSPLV